MAKLPKRDKAFTGDRNAVLGLEEAIKQVTMVQHRTQWRLTSPGRAITRCVSRLRRDRRRHHRGSAGG